MWIVAKKLHHTPKPQIQGVEPRKRRLSIRTIPCIFGEEKSQETLICCVSVFVCKNVFGREEKMCKKRPGKEQNPKKSLFLWSGGAWGLL